MNSTLINNHWIRGKGRIFSSTTPDEAAVVWQKHSSSSTQVNDAVQAAREAQPPWAALALQQRQAIIGAFTEQLTHNQATLIDAISLETGKPYWEAKSEVQAMINKADISI